MWSLPPPTASAFTLKNRRQDVLRPGVLGVCAQLENLSPGTKNRPLSPAGPHSPQRGCQHRITWASWRMRLDGQHRAPGDSLAPETNRPNSPGDGGAAASRRQVPGSTPSCRQTKAQPSCKGHCSGAWHTLQGRERSEGPGPQCGHCLLPNTHVLCSLAIPPPLHSLHKRTMAVKERWHALP